jgi:hypothetical protein
MFRFICVTRDQWNRATTEYASWVSAKETYGTVSSAFKEICLRSPEAKERNAPSSAFALTRTSRMDEVTRPPRKEDLVKLCEELNRLGAMYIVIGGLAMNNLGLVRTTEDVDLLIDPSPDNQRIVREALLILPEKAILELGADEDLQQWVVTRVNDEITVDLMTEACGVRYQEAKADVQIREVQSVPIPMASRRLMIKLKQSRRPKDQIDLQFLLQIDD